MREAHSRERARAGTRALLAAIGWMMLVQLACVLAWQAEWFGRSGALVYWLLVGVLPPALALAGMERSTTRR